MHVGQGAPYGVYWQAIAYDTYKRRLEGGRANHELIHYPDDGPLNVSVLDVAHGHHADRDEPSAQLSFLYAAPEVVNSDRQMLLDATFDPQGKPSLPRCARDPFLRQGDQYRRYRRASPWIRPACNRIPRTIRNGFEDRLPPVAGYQSRPRRWRWPRPHRRSDKSVHDKAIAVRDYCVPISTTAIKSMPRRMPEPVDYILFDLKLHTLLCLAMAVMLRSQGIPARLISGYALGEYDEPTQSYRVRAVEFAYMGRGLLPHPWLDPFRADASNPRRRAAVIGRRQPEQRCQRSDARAGELTAARALE